MKCVDCKGRGWFVDFHYRKDCISCDGTGEMDPEKIKGAEAALNDGVPEHVKPDDTQPMFFMPDIELDDGSKI